MKNLKQYAFAILSALAIASCEKEETLETTNLNIEENDSDALEAKLVLNKSYDTSLLSKEEINAQFEKEIATYMSSQKKSENKATTSFFIRVGNTTGNGTNDGTTNTIKARVIVNTNVGTLITGDLNLGTFHPRNHHQSSLWQINTNSFITEVETQDMQYRVVGQDGWSPVYLDALMRVSDQNNITAEGETIIFGFTDDLTIVGNIFSDGLYSTAGDSNYSRLGQITFPSPPAVGR